MPRIGVGVLIVGLGLLGCGQKSTVKFTRWADPKPANPITGSAGQFIEIGETVDATAIALARGGKPVTTRTTFFKAERSLAMKAIGSQRAALLYLSSGSLVIPFTPRGLEVAPKHLRGIRLILESLLWDQNAAIESQNFDLAIQKCGQASRLGAQLLAGGGLEATLGCTVLDRSRQLMAKQFARLTPNQLSRLGKLMNSSQAQISDLSITVENESQNMLLCLQQAQDLAERGDFEGLEKALGVACRDEVTLLASLKKDPSKIAGVFDWIGEDIRDRSVWHLEKLKNPKSEKPEPDLKPRKNWRVFYRYFASNLDSLIPMLKRSTARTRLFAIECFLQQKIKTKAGLPESISAFRGNISIDPYTGGPFHYMSGASSFRVYSVGADLVDNGGESGPNFDSPDLVVENRL